MEGVKYPISQYFSTISGSACCTKARPQSEESAMMNSEMITR